MHCSSKGIFGISFFSLIALDQVTKHLAIDVVVNTGISLGLFSSSFLTVILIGILILIASRWGRELYLQSPIATGIFFGGAVSNILDRLLYGGVRDFLPVPILNVHNNIADWAIVLALALAWLFFARRYNTRGQGIGRRADGERRELL